MKNVPWHEEVAGFVEELADHLPDYEIACEHEHSNCLLIANKKVSSYWASFSGGNRVKKGRIIRCLKIKHFSEFNAYSIKLNPFF